MTSEINRRDFFVGTAAATGAFSIVPRNVLGGQGYVAPSDKLTMAHIGCGTEGTHELYAGLLQDPRVQIVAACDPVKDSTDYLDWSKNAIRTAIRRVLERPSWGEGVPGVRAGRDQFKEVVEAYYAKQRGFENYKGCAAYNDFRELLDKEKDVDCVKIMTPDHLHASIGLAAMKLKKPVLVHKPLANRMTEARLVIETARKMNLPTHFLAYSGGGANVQRVVARIKDGVIGPLRSVHNWGRRSIVPIIRATPTWCSEAGTTSAAGPLRTWASIACGRCLPR